MYLYSTVVHTSIKNVHYRLKSNANNRQPMLKLPTNYGFRKLFLKWIFFKRVHGMYSWTYAIRHLSIPTSCTIRHICLVPWCVGLDRFLCIFIYKTQERNIWLFCRCISRYTRWPWHYTIKRIWPTTRWRRITQWTTTSTRYI